MMIITPEAEKTREIMQEPRKDHLFDKLLKHAQVEAILSEGETT